MKTLVVIGSELRMFWGIKFVCDLHAYGHSVVAVFPEWNRKTLVEALTEGMRQTPIIRIFPSEPPTTFEVLHHVSYEDCARQCYELAPKVNAAVLALAAARIIQTLPKHMMDANPMLRTIVMQEADYLKPFEEFERVLTIGKPVTRLEPRNETLA